MTDEPVPEEWRPVFERIVRAFVAGDYELAAGIDAVAPVSEDDAGRIARSIEDYGATLVELTPQTWKTSVVQWTGGHWDVLLDLRTAEEGASDLSLFAQVHEVDDGIRIQVDGVWVE